MMLNLISDYLSKTLALLFILQLDVRKVRQGEKNGQARGEARVDKARGIGADF
jgi:hypothetical protein